jgi:hypothetical protein
MRIQQISLTEAFGNAFMVIVKSMRFVLASRFHRMLIWIPQAMDGNVIAGIKQLTKLASL